jgi:hypothetical protein
MCFSFHGPPSALEVKGSRGSMRLYARLICQLRTLRQEKERRNTAHKYEGLTIFQRAFPRSRRDCGITAAGGIIPL